MSKVNYKLLFDSSSLPACVIRGDFLHLVNPAMVKISGFTERELLSMPFGELVHPEDRGLVVKGASHVLEHMSSGESLFRSVTRQGRVIHVRGVFSLVEYDGGLAVLAQLVDMTKQRQIEDELRESEEKYRLLMDNIEDGYYETDLAGNLIQCNGAMASIYGVPDREPFRGTGYRDYVDEEHVGLVYSTFNKVFRTGEPEKGLVLVITARDGLKKTLELSVSLARDGKGRPAGFRGIVRDITGRKQMEERLMYMSLHDSLTGLYNRAYFEEEMRRLEKGRSGQVGIIVCDVDGLKLVNDAKGHDAGDELLAAAANVIKDSFRGSDMVSRIGGDEFAILLPGCDRDSVEKACQRIRGAIASYNESNRGPFLSISIGFAVADMSSCLGNTFKEADNNMYREKLHRSQSNRSAVVRTLMKTLEMRDFATDGHAHRMQALVTGLAKAVGLTCNITDLCLLARFHDVGKVGIPDSILLKPGPLTPEETMEMRRHSEIGHLIAAAPPDLAPIADWILKHHEWWDGRGYPLGLKGEEIPLECRMLAIADAYDAMTNDRPHRKALSHREAVAELTRCAGTQFDPVLVPVFIRMLEEGGDIDNEIPFGH